MLRTGILLLLGTLAVLAQGQPKLEGDWSGTLFAGSAKLRLSLHIEKAPDGLYTGKLNSLDQGAVLPFDVVDLRGDQVRFEIKAAQAHYEGTLAGDKITGTWTQGVPMPLEFSRGLNTAPAKPPERPHLTTAQMAAFGIPVDLYVPTPPTPVLLEGKTHLMYELHIINGGGNAIDLKRLEILGDGKVLAGYEGQELNALLYRVDVSAAADKRYLPSGVHAAAFLDVALDPGAPVPAELRHRVAVEDLTTEGGTVAVSKAKLLTLGPPLHGDRWMAANGPSNISGHRRALMPVEGRYHIVQRFAIDWLRLGADGKSYTGDPNDNKSYHAYGSEVLAVADGTVVEVKDGIPENVPGLTSRAVPITLETVGGNHIVLDLGGGHYAFYGHLQPGKLRVHKGDRVKRGEVLALVGNSGNSTEPHLHFHLSDGISTLGSEGLPYLLESLKALPAMNAMVKFDGQ